MDTPREWLLYADENLQVAQREMKEKMPAYHTICFLAADKFLKGYLIAQGWTLEKTHDIVALLSMSASYNIGFEGLAHEGAVLNEYLIAGRYPGDISFEQVGEIEAREALNAAQNIRNLVRKFMGDMIA